MAQRPPFEQFAVGAEQLASLLDAVEELLLILSPEGAILFAASSFSKVVGRSADELIGQPIFDFVNEDDRSILARLLRESSFEPKARGRCRLRTKDADSQWFKVVIQNRLQDPAV